MTSATNELARITIDSPDRRLDLAVPADVPVADLIRVLVRADGERLAERQAATGWVVRREDGALLSGAKSLHEHGVRDGDVLYLVPADETWPEFEYDDIAEAIAATRRDGNAWTPSATRRIGVGVGVAALLVALAEIVRATSHPTTALIAAGFAAVLLGTGVILARAASDAATGAVLGALAIPYAAVAGLLGRGIHPYALDLVVACVAAAVVVWFAALGVGRTTWVFIAAGLAAVLGAVGAALDRFTTPVDAAAIVLGGVTLAAGLVPIVAVRFGGLVDWDPDALASAVARGDAFVVGLCGGGAVAATGAATVLVRSGSTWPLLLVLASGIALAVRARVYGTLRARMAAVAGAVGVALPLVGWAVWSGFAPAAVVAALALAGVLLLLGRPAGARAAAAVEAISLLAILPLLCGALGLYARARALH